MIIVEAFVRGLRTEGPHAGQPICGVVEDEDAVRWLMTDFPCPEGIWIKSVQMLAQGIIHDDGVLSIPEVEALPRADGAIQAPVEAPGAIRMRSSRPFVHLHAHSEFSPLDGLATIEEMVDEAVADGQEAIALTDHGVCAGHLELQRVAQAKGVKPIFGVEAYLVDDARDKDPSTLKNYWHFILLAKNEVGLRNLWRASTMAHSPEQFYGRPRMDWRTLAECSEGLIASTACLRGPLTAIIEDGDEARAINMISRMRGIFGDDLLLELHLNTLDRQIVTNKGLVELAHSQSVPLIVVGDSHYSCTQHRDAHQIWIAAQTDKTLQDDGDLFTGDQHYHLHSADEAVDLISYLGYDVAEAAVAHTAEVARMCDITIKPRPSTPVYHRHEVVGEAQGVDKDYELLERLCREAAIDRFPDEVDYDDELSAVYHERLRKELDELREKGYCGYMLVVWDYCAWCRDNGILMGPGRGSAAGSIVCYLLGITQLDPIEHDLIFERFINPGRTELPDVDSDFPKSKRNAVIDYIVQRWGEKHVVRVGTIMRLRNKQTFRDIARVFKGGPDEIEWTDSDAISAIIDDAESSTAGIGLPWDELWAQEHEQLAPFAEKYPEMFRHAETLVGRVRGYGKHPGGVVIDPLDAISDWLPLRQGEDDHPVTEFPMEDLGFFGLVKFDILTIRTLDTIQHCIDLLADDERYSGKVPHPHSWREEYDDPVVWDMLCSGDTLGVFQVETSSGTRLVKRFQPRSLADLCAVLTLVRPGPMRSGLTDSYIRRRDGQEQVSYSHPLLEKVLHKTFGTMIYQEDIMNVCQVIAGYSLPEADEVRSILGKKKVDKVAAEGQRFRHRAKERQIDEEVAERLFRQMEEFARYTFNKAHSLSYSVLAFWCAWFKAHFPAHWIVACLSTADKDRFPEFVMDARRKGFSIDLPDVNESGKTFTVSVSGLGIRYGLSSIKGLGDAAAEAILEGRPYTSFEDFVERRGSKCNWGHIKLLASIGALDSLLPEGSHRRQLEDVCAQMAEGKLEQCAHLVPDTLPSMGVDVCCGFDWLSEPVKIGKSGKPLKPKPIPKKCTKACRQYTPTSSIVWRELPVYTPREIRRIEKEAFGLYVSSTPFDMVAEKDRADLTPYEDLDAAPTDPPLFGVVLAEIQNVKRHTDRQGRQMAFLDLLLETGQIDVTVFHKTWAKSISALRPGAFGLFSVQKNTRGYTMSAFVPMKQE